MVASKRLHFLSEHVIGMASFSGQYNYMSGTTETMRRTQCPKGSHSVPARGKD